MAHGQIIVTQGGVELWGGEEDGKDLYIRCLAGMGNQEIELMDASAYLGLRITIRKFGRQTVYLNPDGDNPTQTIEGKTTTYTLPGTRVTIQAVYFGGTSYGWEVVAD
jgi:hypothetical protein